MFSVVLSSQFFVKSFFIKFCVLSCSQFRGFLRSEPSGLGTKKGDCKKIPTFENDDTRSTMSEPAKDTAIEITPKPQASSVRVPRIVAEINRVASRVRDRNKKEEEDNDDSEVLENDTPTPSQKPVDIKIIRENTHYRGRKRLNILVAFLLVLISVLLLAVCVFLARIDENIRSGGGANIQSLASPPPPSPYSPPPPPPTVFTQESMEYKTIVWEADGYPNSQYGTSFPEVMEIEGVSEDEISGCSYAVYSDGGWARWNYASTSQRTCVLMILVDKLLQENWRLMSVPEYWNSAYGSVLFTRTNYTTPTVAVSTVSAPSASVSMEHKAVIWSNNVADFRTSAENEGVSTTDMVACSSSTSTSNDWSNISSLYQKCLVELLLSTLAKENWTLTTHNAFGSDRYPYEFRTNAYHFTRPVQTS